MGSSRPLSLIKSVRLPFLQCSKTKYRLSSSEKVWLSLIIEGLFYSFRSNSFSLNKLSCLFFFKISAFSIYLIATLLLSLSKARWTEPKAPWPSLEIILKSVIYSFFSQNVLYVRLKGCKLRVMLLNRRTSQHCRFLRRQFTFWY